MVPTFLPYFSYISKRYASVSSLPEAEFMNIQFHWGFWVKSWEISDWIWGGGLRIQCLHYKPISNHFCWRGRRSKIRLLRWLWMARRKTLKTFVPITVGTRIRPLLLLISFHRLVSLSLYIFTPSASPYLSCSFSLSLIHKEEFDSL
jgi:hypothetical protein